LFSAIVSTLKQIPESTLQSLSSETQLVKSLAFGLGVVQGMFVARQLFGAHGLNQWYPFNQVQMIQSIEGLKGRLLKSSEDDEPKLDEMIHMFSEVSSDTYFPLSV